MTANSAALDGVDLKWLDEKAPSTTITGTSFGIPWPQGSVDKTTSIAINSSDGSGIPVQTWPLAYWPDGSLKWTGHALAASENLVDTFHLSVDTPTEPAVPVDVTQTSDQITVTTGSFTAVFNTSGTIIIDSLSLDGSTKAQAGQLVVHVQNGPDELELEGLRPSAVATTGTIDTVTVEQDGPVRAVIKVTGKYEGGGHAAFLPFTVRFYISAGATAVRMVHFFIYDGDQFNDFIKGIGLTFSTPLSDELYNRHIRFVTAKGGIWGEPVRVLSGLRVDATSAVLTPQFEGTATPDISTWPTTVTSGIDDLAIWNDFTLDQLSPTRWTVAKRTTAGSAASWLSNAGFGEKAAGVGYLGGATGGGVTFAARNFWEGAPRGIDIRGAGGDTATVTIWAYSPRAVAMDLRGYDTTSHGLDLTYEDVGDPDPNPIGIGRSYELTLQVESATPSRAALADFASVITAVPQVVASPEFYASRHLFGGRCVPDTSSSGLATIEQQKSDILDFYIKEIDQRQFYGFWDYGDFMHTYDQTRHTWRYDVGGYAWDNGELGYDVWLWLSFLRTGRADVFRLAYALTRHLSEVDFHHTGPFAGLGSRHHVTHWGGAAKEARVSSSTIKRPFYYLTADELIGDIMEYSLQADQTLLPWEPLRKVAALPSQAPSRVRIGPDWTALSGNWFTQWERTNDSQWKDKIVTGMTDIANMKYGLFSGPLGGAVGWFPDTAHLVDEGGEGENTYHLAYIFGGGEFFIELVETITEVPAFDSAWIDFCKYYNASDDVQIARYGKKLSIRTYPQWYAKLTAYAGERLNDDTLKQQAWTILNDNTTGVWPPASQVGGTDVPNPVTEIVDLATNDTAALSVSQYAVLAIAPEFAPNSFVPQDSITESLAETSTVASLRASSPLDEKSTRKIKIDNAERKEKKSGAWKRLLCLK
ncbi:uncharacterized protein STEHIDRAFT_62271 [Stereum hirsutum FP-91666 SS1]|uniref:uncharacterized protein n=1 Tax=Stereum hirsutum (strain FP-91666) TaxID=721885 RepID=UPI0004449790|nr:uncharacterized protein STEHIDRAFT_62271 [Stereum hirsutum FP-91666 SS1]EIM83855.1 hypothetical protein STEHIDRAFT_62271 [Stereum hirsutum FP-91666 SS1]